MKEYYYLDVKRKVQGPHTMEALAGMLRAGTLTTATEVAAPGDARWVALGSLVSAEQVASAQLPPVPGVVGAPGKCPSCAAELKTEDGALPVRCPQCGRVLRSARGGFWGNLVLPFRQYAKFSGRATRAEYWIATVFITFVMYAVFISGVVLVLVGSLAPERNETLMMGGAIAMAVGTVMFVLSILPLTALQVRRLHDVGFSGWWVGVYLLSELVYLGVFYIFCRDSWQVLNESIEQSLMNGDTTCMQTFQMAMQAPASPAMTALSLFNMMAQMLCLLLFIVSFFDSQRGPNKYGPSRKYPMG